MNIKKIKELIELMNENDLNELEVEEEGMKVKLAKKTNGSIEQEITPFGPRKSPASEQQAAADSPGKQEVTGKEIKSPMVGTFYSSPAPEEPAYVTVGTVIQKGDVLCIIEAMKLMNEVKSEIAGKIIKISIGNAEPVEYGQTMFVVEPA
ncbi:MAG: acetyl-CoA carboxylase biotin carboxyl carrier protein [Candidatus Omnitrophota bacterium]